MTNKDLKDKKIEQCFCQSYYDDDNVLQDCTCGKCETNPNQYKDKKIKVVLPPYLYQCGVKMWGKKYMKEWYLKDSKVLLK